MTKSLNIIAEEISNNFPEEDISYWSMTLSEITRELSKTSVLSGFEDDLKFLGSNLSSKSAMIFYKELQLHAPLGNWRHIFLIYFGHYEHQMKSNEDVEMSDGLENSEDDIPM